MQNSLFLKQSSFIRTKLYILLDTEHMIHTTHLHASRHTKLKEASRVDHCDSRRDLSLSVGQL